MPTATLAPTQHSAPLPRLMLASATLATATSALGLTHWHWPFKPLTMLVAMVWVAIHARQTSANGLFDLKTPTPLLLAALLGSLAGDVFLMLPGNWFIPGLVSFLLAHLAYIALFGQGVPWFAHRSALAATLALAAAMYAFLWLGGLPPELRLPVAVYVLVIALMAAQAWARRATLRDTPALLVALGACSFMLSDSILATNRFVQPLPLAQLWVLASYYAAQYLIVRGMLGVSASASAGVPPAGIR